MKKKQNAYMAMLPYIILAVVLIATMFIMNLANTKVNQLTTGELMSEINKNKVTEDHIQYVYACIYDGHKRTYD